MLYLIPAVLTRQPGRSDSKKTDSDWPGDGLAESASDCLLPARSGRTSQKEDPAFWAKLRCVSDPDLLLEVKRRDDKVAVQERGIRLRHKHVLERIRVIKHCKAVEVQSVQNRLFTAAVGYLKA